MLVDGFGAFGTTALVGAIAAFVLGAASMILAGGGPRTETSDRRSRIEGFAASAVIGLAFGGWVYAGLPALFAGSEAEIGGVTVALLAGATGVWFGCMGIGYVRALGSTESDEALAATTLIGGCGVVVAALAAYGSRFLQASEFFEAGSMVLAASQPTLADLGGVASLVWPLTVTVAGGVVAVALVAIWRAERSVGPRTARLVGSALVGLALAAGIGWWLDSHLRGHLVIWQQSSAGPPQTDTVEYTLPTSSAGGEYTSHPTVQMNYAGITSTRGSGMWRRPASEVELSRIGPELDLDEDYRRPLDREELETRLSKADDAEVNWVLDDATPFAEWQRGLEAAHGAGLGPHHLAVARRPEGESFDPDIDEPGQGRRTWIPPETHDIAQIEVEAAPESEAGRGADEAPPLAVEVTAEGFEVSVGGEKIEPRDGCPSDGPTVCLAGEREPVDSALETGPGSEFDAATLREMVAQYDFVGLYRTVSTLADDHPEFARYSLTAGDDLPLGLLVCVMDTLRYERDVGAETSAEAFWRAAPSHGSGTSPSLASTPVVVF